MRSKFFYFVGFDNLHAAQREWIEALLQMGQAECILYQHGHWLNESVMPPIRTLVQQGEQPKTDNPYSACLDAEFRVGEHSPLERAQAFHKAHPVSPLAKAGVPPQWSGPVSPAGR